MIIENEKSNNISKLLGKIHDGSGHPLILFYMVSLCLQFDDVSFSYPGNHSSIHKNLSFIVKEGERVGIVGPSGCGKTSILKLLLRFYDIQSGAIKIGNLDIKDLDPETIRSKFSIVSQDTFLFHGTVEENIRIGCPDASWSQIEEAVIAANAKEFVDRLPDGYQTLIGERGIRLSGGQRQRLAIARALLRNAEILILDEALSSVDAENESIIQEALDRLMEGRTTLVFAHRLSSIISSDKILVLDNGGICEEGTHQQLMDDKGFYHSLMKSQIQVNRLNSQNLITKDIKTSKSLDTFFSNNKVKSKHSPEVVEASGLSWNDAFSYLLKEVRPWLLKFLITLTFGIGRVSAYIGVGAASALAVAAVKLGVPYYSYLIILGILAPFAGILHWTESWIAHDMAFRMLTEMRIKLFKRIGVVFITLRLRT